MGKEMHRDKYLSEENEDMEIHKKHSREKRNNANSGNIT